MDEKELVKDRNDIADVIREYLELKPAGSRSFKAICPFHHEKTPSLHVSQEKQIWHCFGCGKGGDVISFVMEMQGIEFREALEQLARKAGITLTERAAPQDGARKHLFELNDQAAKFFEAVLHEHELGAAGREYLKARDIDTELAKKFRLGFAPKAWDALVRSFEKRGVTKERLVKAGLAKKGTKSDIIDLFRERLTIPIRDIQGRVLGFTGRALTKDAFGPKYLNTPETEVFKKRALLYGVYEGRTAIRLENKVIITEGNIDVISSHKAGVEYIVASSGTALTEEHIGILKRLTEHLLFCFDADAAGFRAAQKGIHLAQAHGMRIQVIRIPRELGKDPDEVVRTNPVAWKAIVEKPIHIMQFYIEELARVHNVGTPEGKSAFVRAAADEVARMKDAVEQDYWMQRIADVAHIDTDTVRKSLKPLAPAIKAPVAPVATQRPTKQTPISRAEMLFWELICMLLEAGLSPAEALKEADVPAALRELYNKFLSLYDAAVASADPRTYKQQLLTHFITPETSYIRAIMIRIEELSQVKEHNTRVEIERHVTSLKQIARDEQKKMLEADIRIAEQQGNQERLEQLLKEYQALIQ